MPESLPTAFHDLPAHLFPLTMRAYPVGSSVCVWSETVEGPAAIHIPALAQEHGPVRMTIEFADGSVTPDGEATMNDQESET